MNVALTKILARAPRMIARNILHETFASPHTAGNSPQESTSARVRAHFACGAFEVQERITGMQTGFAKESEKSLS